MIAEGSEVLVTGLSLPLRLNFYWLDGTKLLKTAPLMKNVNVHSRFRVVLVIPYIPLAPRDTVKYENLFWHA